MTTHCRIGDRAIIIRSDAGNEGMIVRVTVAAGHMPKEPLLYGGVLFYYPTPGDVLWEIVSEGRPFTSANKAGGKAPCRRTIVFPDSWLRPLPKNPEEVPADCANA